MASYTQEQLDELIVCRKQIIEPPKKQFTTRMGHRRNGMRVASGGRMFSVFMRICIAFEEDFSIGLVYEPSGDSSIMLLRCNGPHGITQSLTNPHPHFGFHVHRASKAMIDQGRRPEANATITTEYAYYTQALRYFLKHANIEWTSSDFPGLEQKELFE